MTVQILVGYGPSEPQLLLCIGNIPHFSAYASPAPYRPMQPGEIAFITANTSNHWRKAFNVYAKLIWQWLSLDAKQKTHFDKLCASGITRWQDYRDSILFGPDCRAALLFSPITHVENSPLHHNHSTMILAGKTYGLQQCANAHINLITVDSQFWCAPAKNLVVSPYPDYRQLSNARINQLVELIVSPPFH